MDILQNDESNLFVRVTKFLCVFKKKICNAVITKIL